MLGQIFLGKCTHESKIILCLKRKKYGLIKIRVQKNLAFKNLDAKKILGQKYFWLKKEFGLKNDRGQKNCWSKENFLSKGIVTSTNVAWTNVPMMLVSCYRWYHKATMKFCEDLISKS